MKNRGMHAADLATSELTVMRKMEFRVSALRYSKLYNSDKISPLIYKSCSCRRLFEQKLDEEDQ